MRLALPMLLLLAALVLLLFFQPPGHTPRTLVPLLDTNLRPIGEAPSPPETYKGLVLVGRAPQGYVYARPESVYRPVFLDRFLFLLGTTKEVNVPSWWLEKDGTIIEPLTGRAFQGALVVVKTAYEVIKSSERIVPVYRPIFLGREINLGENCVAVKYWGDLLVPVLLPPGGIADPDADVRCQECEPVEIKVVDSEGKPLAGFFSTGDGMKYTFFGKFSSVVRVCPCQRVKVYVSGYRPAAATVCKPTVIRLQPLERGIRVEGYIVLDSTGALVSFMEPMVVPEGAYRFFVPFPLHEKDRTLPAVDVGKTVWDGRRLTKTPSLYSIVREGNTYYYVLKEGLVSIEGLLCREGVCTTPGEVPLLAFGGCELHWSGGLRTECPTLGIKVNK